MITLVPPDFRTDPALMDTPGAFLWWYVDVRDDRGNGAVLIWSFGLPFLPGLTARERAGEPLPPRARPSLNVALYRDGRPDFYLLRTFAPDEAAWQPPTTDGHESWRFGHTTITSAPTGHRERTVTLHLDLPVPSSSANLRGTLHVNGREVSHAPVDVQLPKGPAGHHWSPLVPHGRGHGTLTLDSAPELALDGDAYHDRNASPTPLHRLGIDHWIWGRTRIADHTLIHYLVWPEDPASAPVFLALDIAPNGTVKRPEPLEVHLPSARRTFFGMPWWPEVTLNHAGSPWLHIQHLDRVDDGPFYLRFGTRTADALGREGLGWGELVRPSRIDLARHRPLVRMAVHESQGANSFWLPLFSGPREGRLRRLLLRR